MNLSSVNKLTNTNKNDMFQKPFFFIVFPYLLKHYEILFNYNAWRSIRESLQWRNQTLSILKLID